VKMVRFYASDWLRKEINRGVRRARHQGRITTTASHVIRELLHHAIAAQGAGRSKRALKARALRRPRALQDVQEVGSKDGQEKEGIAVLARTDGGSIFQSLSAIQSFRRLAWTIRDQLLTGEYMELLRDLGEEIQAWAYYSDFANRHPEE